MCSQSNPIGLISHSTLMTSHNKYCYFFPVNENKILIVAITQSVRPLSEQLEQFKEYIGKLKENFGEEKTNFILSKSLVLVVSSSNDIANTYFASGIRKLDHDVPRYTDMLVQLASSFVKVISYSLNINPKIKWLSQFKN